jgi:hypothetical protein
MKSNEAKGDTATIEPKIKTADFAIHYGGSISLFIPLTDSAHEWLDRHCPPDGEHLYSGPNLVVEARYLGDLIEYAIRDGLTPPATN